MLETQRVFLDSYDQALLRMQEEKIDVHFETFDDEEYIHLDYGIAASRTSNIVRECRGLVLKKKDFSVIRYPFQRFLNFDETGRDPFDFNNPVFYQDKLDGSLIILHYLNGKWIAGTRGKLVSNATISGYNITFPELFFSIFTKIDQLDPNIQYFFELCAPQNRVVVFHPVPFVGLIGARKIDTWEELHPNELDVLAEKLSVRRPNYYDFSTIKECIEYTKNLPSSQEGFVIQQWNDKLNRFCRSKIKSELYITLHNLTSARSLNNLVRLVIDNQRGVLNDFPEYLDSYDLIDRTLSSYALEVEKVFSSSISILNDPLDSRSFKERRKAFAQQVCQTPYSHICFGLADGKFKTVQEWFKQMNTRSGIKDLISRLSLDKIVGSSWNVVENLEEDI